MSRRSVSSSDLVAIAQIGPSVAGGALMVKMGKISISKNLFAEIYE